MKFSAKDLFVNISIIIISTIVVFFDQINGPSANTVLIISLIHVILGSWIYLSHGKNYVTCLGIFSLSSVVFMAVPPIFSWLSGDKIIGVYYVIAAYVSLIALCIINIITGPTKQVEKAYCRLSQSLKDTSNTSSLYILLLYSLLCLGFSITVDFMPLSFLENFKLHSLFISIGCLYTIYLLNRNNKISIFMGIISLPLFIYSLIYYITNVMGSFGRIRIVTLVYIMLIITSIFLNSKKLKKLPILVSPLFLVWSGLQRGATNFRKVILTGEGITSAFAPYITLVEVLEEFQDTVGNFLYGKTYLNNLALLIPREVWASKPKGLGAIYTEWFAPHLVSVGHSYAPSYLGEAYVNLYYFGFILLPILLGLIIRYIDNKLVVNISKEKFTPLIIIRFLIFVMIVSGIFDYIWADSNTYSQRTGIRIVLLYMAYIVLWILKSESYKRNTKS